MRVLGLSAFYHDSAAALIEDGRIVAAAQEERFTRRKHDARFPDHAIRYCLGEAGIPLSKVDWVVFYEKPFLKFDRLLETYLAYAPRGFASFRKSMPIWFGEKLFQKSLLAKRLKALDASVEWRTRLLFSEHHLSHGASAFFPSPFPEAAVLTMDGTGEWATTSLMHGKGNQLLPLREVHFPHSLGLLYSAFTYYLGFKVNSGEYKVMGLAPYGEPRFKQKILDSILSIHADGSFRLNLEHFDYCTGLKMTRPSFGKVFGEPRREPEAKLGPVHMDIAASLQAVTEDAVFALAAAAKRETGAENLCLAGGVALNCVANGKLHAQGLFKRLWVQPASGDAGGALGAALAGYYVHARSPRSADGGKDHMRGSLLGPAFGDVEIRDRLTGAGADVETIAESDLAARCAKALADGHTVAWFQGRMEYGPRALGARSILGDPRARDMQTRLNLQVKFRESFRPFAPAVLREDLETWFDLDTDSPYMLLVAPVAEGKRRPPPPDELDKFGIERLKLERSEIPAVTHVDYSARVQTVEPDVNPRFHALLREFKRLTGCPVLVNTSFNVRGEPIVCTPEDAYRCFMGTELDLLVVGTTFVWKDRQKGPRAANYHQAFELD